MSTFTPQPVEQIRASNTYNFLFGRFHLHNFGIPYLIVSMKLTDVIEDLDLPEDVNFGFEDAKIEELYQRQIDWSRVLTRIVPYLEDDKRPQFFNAITATLLPYRDRKFVPFDAGGFNAPQLGGQFSVNLTLGPVELGLYSGKADDFSTFQVGQVKWNREQVRCVAIDGQHRLAALKQLKGHNLGSSNITVILVIPSPALGLVGDQNHGNHLKLMRKLFTDLNKHAEKVSRSRELLLDDYDPQSICVRRSICNELSSVTPLWRDMDPTRLPLSFLNWHTNDAKFDTGPYVTTLLVLDQIVGGLLNIKPIRDWTEEGEVNAQITALERMGWVRSQECKSRLEKLELGTPFSYTETDLSEIGAAFASRWSSSITLILTKIYAYSQLIDFRTAKEMMRSDFVMWFEAYETNKKQGNDKTLSKLTRIRDDLKRQGLDPNVRWRPCFESTPPALVDPFTTLKAGSLFFTVVFQKALFEAIKFLAPLARSSDEDPETILFASSDKQVQHQSSPDGLNTYLWSRDLVNGINAIGSNHNGNFFTRLHRTDSAPHDMFWLGTIIRADDPEVIDFTNAAAKGASRWLVLIAFLWHAAERNTGVLDQKIGKMKSWSEILETIEGHLPECSHLVNATAENLFGNKQGRPMRKIVQAATGLSEEELEESPLLEEHFMRRFKHLWKRMSEAREG